MRIGGRGGLRRGSATGSTIIIGFLSGDVRDRRVPGVTICVVNGVRSRLSSAERTG